MPHYAHMIAVSRLQASAQLGFYTGERAKPQPVEVCFRLYFPQAPAASSNDEADFIDYGQVCKVITDYIAQNEFKLIEYMGAVLFREVRAELDRRGGTGIKLWLRLNKIAAPVPGLTGGASFIHCDLEPGATVATNS